MRRSTCLPGVLDGSQCLIAGRQANLVAADEGSMIWRTGAKGPLDAAHSLRVSSNPQTATQLGRSIRPSTTPFADNEGSHLPSLYGEKEVNYLTNLWDSITHVLARLADSEVGEIRAERAER
ncbi:hypothetical protein SAMN05216277_10639 [Halolamina pelagica]|uniref:Uncharacterized protein n=1 Tax=Halolamina pelagica TaxID=699431 RepID=A0A1I5SBZ3_9EURY|nr:hypothetical protein SAMN05216277_10639 [Halolamina pelagica]